MFVPYKPVSSLDVYRNSENCVCGALSVVTNKGGEHHGYCNECVKKRERFADLIISYVDYDNCDIVESAILSVLENIRKTILKERIYYLIDLYFSENQECETFKEPYEDDEFKLKVYREKIRIQNDLLKNIPYVDVATKLYYNKKECINLIYHKYFKQIKYQIESDKNTIEVLCKRISGPKKLTKGSGSCLVIM